MLYEEQMFKERLGVNELATDRSRQLGPTMSLTMIVWLCCLPLVFLIVAPFFGWKVAGVAALGLFLVLLVACFGICTTKVYYKEGGERHT